jgi:hypothetical protein
VSRLCVQCIKKLFGTFRPEQHVIKVFAKLPKSNNLPSTIEVHQDYAQANLHAYCTDRILFIVKGKGLSSRCYEKYLVFGEIEGLDPVPIPTLRL